MEIVTIIEIGIVSFSAASSVVFVSQSILLDEARKKLDRARMYYEDNTPIGFRNWHEMENANVITEETQLCGGCGLNLTLDQIGACTGETCPLYLGEDKLTQQGPTMVFTSQSEPLPPGRKINIGFTGSLHPKD